MNHPVKKVEMEQVLGGEIEVLLKEGDIQAIKGIKADEQSMRSIQDLQVKSTNKGVRIDLLRLLAVSDDGSKAWGVHITEHELRKCRLLRQDFERGKSLLYNYEHQTLALALMVVESFDLVITGGYDEKIVLHCLQSGKTLKVLDLGIGVIHCLYGRGSVVAVGGEKQVVFLDLVSQKRMDILPVEVECDITCMQLNIKKSSQENDSSQFILFVGGWCSTKLTEITLPEEIASKSNKNFISLI
jgi:hypothetical protein